MVCSLFLVTTMERVVIWYPTGMLLLGTAFLCVCVWGSWQLCIMQLACMTERFACATHHAAGPIGGPRTSALSLWLRHTRVYKTRLSTCDHRRLRASL